MVIDTQLLQIHSEILNLSSNMYTMQTRSANLEYARSTNLKCRWTIRICVSCKFQIWPENLQRQHIYCHSPNLATNWQYSQIDLHISTLRMHCECICVAFKFGAVCRDIIAQTANIFITVSYRSQVL